MFNPARLLTRQLYGRHSAATRVGALALATMIASSLPASAGVTQYYPSRLPNYVQQSPCAYVMCLEGLSQTPSGVIKGGAACEQLLCHYFGRRIFDSEGYDAVDTALNRNAEYLAGCASPLTTTVGTTWGPVYTAGDCS